MVGLFAGIGGIELGLSRAGHVTSLLCELDPAARAVLTHRFPDVPTYADVRELKKLPKDTELITGGFPCQDISQAGHTKGIAGRNSGLIDEIFRLLATNDVPHVLLENVSFILSLNRGAAMSHVTSELERLGYRWAYRVIDSRAFGLPQRRQRLFLLASRTMDPVEALMDGNHEPRPRRSGVVELADSTGRRGFVVWVGPSMECRLSREDQRSGSLRRPRSG